MSDSDSNPIEALVYALDKYPQRVEALPVRELVMDSARQNPKRPAYVKLAVPDEVVKSVRGRASDSEDLVLLVRVPKEVRQRQGSRIVLPGEV